MSRRYPFKTHERIENRLERKLQQSEKIMDADGFELLSASDIGQKRTKSQDHVFAANLPRQLIVEQIDVVHKRQSGLFCCHDCRLLVVADRMGRHVGGERAGRTASDAVTMKHVGRLRVDAVIPKPVDVSLLARKALQLFKVA